jgi:hypothetical protein
MKKTKHLEDAVLREGLRDYFEEQSAPQPQANTLAALVKKALGGVNAAQPLTFGKQASVESVVAPAKTQAPEPAPKTTPGASTNAACEEAEDRLLKAVGEIVKTHYSIQDPSPAARIGENLPPLTYVIMPGDGSVTIMLLPFPPEAEIAPNRLDSTLLDPDMLEKLELLFDHLEGVADGGVQLAYDRTQFKFSIHCEDAYALLYLFEDLMLSQDYPCRDTLYFTALLEKKDRTEEGEKVFASRKEHLAYVREASTRDRILSKGIMDASPEQFMMALPARAFENFAEAARVGMDYMALESRLPFINVSFARLERDMDIATGVEPADVAQLPSLMYHH